MNKYTIEFKVQGDKIADSLIIEETIEAVNLTDLVEKTYDTYAMALQYMWKKMEVAVEMKPLPNELFNIKCYKGLDAEQDYINSAELLNAFYQKRKKNWLSTVQFQPSADPKKKIERALFLG